MHVGSVTAIAIDAADHVGARLPYMVAGVILLSFLYMFAYVSVTAALEFTMFSAALLWRNDQWLRQARTVSRR